MQTAIHQDAEFEVHVLWHRQTKQQDPGTSTQLQASTMLPLSEQKN